MTPACQRNRSCHTVAILCVAPKTIYRSIPDLDIYDARRDARSFPGGMPIIAHPPCRAWSAFTKQQAKPSPGEKELGLWCAQQLKLHGGILEQPAFSELFSAAALPIPGSPPQNHLWSLEVWQAWWGYPLRKRTWLAFSHINHNLVHIPLRLHPPGRDRRRQQLMSKQQRSATNLAFASWLVHLARSAYNSYPLTTNYLTTPTTPPPPPPK